MIVLPPRLLVSRLRKVSTTCLVLLLNLLRGCASELGMLKGKLPPVLKYQAESVQNGRV